MGSEPVEELPDDLEAWVAERAAAADTTRAAVVRRLMAAHRLLDEHPESLDDADVASLGGDIARPPDGADSGVDDLGAHLDDLSGRVEGLESDLDEKITDVRERVIQVKREADDKAPAGHDHPSIDRRIDDGFGDYEEILESLVERTEALEEGGRRPGLEAPNRRERGGRPQAAGGGDRRCCRRARRPPPVARGREHTRRHAGGVRALRELAPPPSAGRPAVSLR